MHILVVANWYPANRMDFRGGFIRDQVEALVSAGHRVGVIYPQLESFDQLIKKARVTAVDNETNYPVLRGWGIAWTIKSPRLKSWLWQRQGMKLYRAYSCKHGAPDLLHAHVAINAGLLAAEINKKTGIPFILTEHSSLMQRAWQPAWEKIKAAKCLASAHRCLAVSKSLVKFLGDYFPGTEWQYVPNILNPIFESSENVTKKINDDFYFCHVSGFDRNKRVDNIIKSFAAGFKESKNVRLLLGGDGAEKEELTDLVQRLGIQSQVNFLGRLDRFSVLEMMRRSDAYLMASEIETFGVALIEALSQGLPVVATECGGPNDIVTQENGYLVPVDDVVSMTTAMLKLYKNYNCFNRKNIISKCIGQFGSKSIASSLSKIYSVVVLSERSTE